MEMNDDIIYMLITMLDNQSCIQFFNTCIYFNKYKKNGYLKSIVYDNYNTTYNNFILSCSVHYKYIKSFIFKDIDDPFEWIPFGVQNIYLYNCSIYTENKNIIFSNVVTIYLINTSNKKTYCRTLSMFPNVKCIYLFGNVSIPNKYMSKCVRLTNPLLE